MIAKIYTYTLLLLIGLTKVAMAESTTSLPLSILPPEAEVRKAFAQHPQLRIGSMGVEVAEQNRSRLIQGSHEWTGKLSLNRREEFLGGQYREQEFVLERPIRWFGKAKKDKDIGNKATYVAKSMYADLWHEASRALMKDWFDLYREIYTVKRLQQQLELVEKLDSIVKKRVKAGDAPKIDEMQSSTEIHKVIAQLSSAKQREEVLRKTIEITYPGISLPIFIEMPDPIDLKAFNLAQKTDYSGYWIEQIMSDNHELELAQAEAEYVGLLAQRLELEKYPDPTIGFKSARERNGSERIMGVSISIPFPGEARTYERKAAYTKAQIANEKLLQVKAKVRLNAERLLVECQRSYEVWNSLELVSKKSSQQASLIQNAYQLGEVGISDAMNSRRLALESLAARDAAQLDALYAFAKLNLDGHLIWRFD